MAKTEVEIIRRRVSAILLTVFLIAALVAGYLCYAPDHPRHPYLSGWFLFVVMLFLTFFNLRKKVPFLKMGSTAFWLQLHVYVGIFSGALFIGHSGFSWPFGILHQVLAVWFWLVFISGVIGLWISRSFPKRLTVAGCEIPFERIPYVRMQLKQEAEALVLAGVDGRTSPVIADFYTERLGMFFTRHLNRWSHLLRSRSPQAAHQSQFEEIRRYARKGELDLLDQLEGLVQRKHMLDHQHAHQLTLRVWLFAHIPLSYSLLILSVLHIIVVYSFSGSAP